jgi:hypothetical protein
MVAELLAVEPLRTKSVHLPGLAELATRPSVTGSPSLVVHHQSLLISLGLEIDEAPSLETKTALKRTTDLSSGNQ